jgi:hypothetical protein
LTKERRLRVFENGVLRKIFGPKRNEVTWEWRKLHNEELNDLYCSPTVGQIERNEMSWACSAYGEGTGVYRVLVGNQRGKETTVENQA